jgi:1-deoxy-D-xylulose-5-phosphate synthase
MRFVKPLDADLVAQLARSHALLVTLEDNVVMGGAGSAVAESLAERDIAVSVLHLGLPDRFVDHGEQGQLLAQLGLSGPGVAAAVRARLGGTVSAPTERAA